MGLFPHFPLPSNLIEMLGTVVHVQNLDTGKTHYYIKHVKNIIEHITRISRHCNNLRDTLIIHH